MLIVSLKHATECLGFGWPPGTVTEQVRSCTGGSGPKMPKGVRVSVIKIIKKLVVGEGGVHSLVETVTKS